MDLDALLHQPAHDGGNHRVALDPQCDQVGPRSARRSFRTAPGPPGSPSRPASRAAPGRAPRPGSQRQRSATTRPRLTNATRSQVASTSPSRCELRNTVTLVGAQFVDDVAHQQAAERIEARGGLVEKHELRIVEQRLGEADALQHALAVAAQRAIGGVEQVDAGQQPSMRASSATPRSRRGGRGSAAARSRSACRESGSARAESRSARAPRDRRAARRARARAGRRLDQRQQHLDRRRLAGAVRAEKAEDLPAPTWSDRSATARVVAELLAQRVGLDDAMTLDVRRIMTNEHRGASARRAHISAPSLPWPTPARRPECSPGRTRDRASTRRSCWSATDCAVDAE